jgi:C-terminal processing protease CtpA/Prc
MFKVSSFLRLSFAVATVAVIIAAGLGTKGENDALAATQPANAPKFDLCVAPPPTNTPKPTKAATAAATKIATVAATKAATAAATKIATAAATKIATAAATKIATVAATKIATAAATKVATAAATKVATAAATKVATAAATTVATAAATQVAPTATTIPVGKKPATAGLTPYVNTGATPKLLYKNQECVSVRLVTAGGPADVAGIKVDDLILGFDKVRITTSAEFSAQVNKHASGDTVEITIQRDGKAIPVAVTLGLNPFATQ